MPNYGKYKDYMNHNPPSIAGYMILNTFKTRQEAKEELDILKQEWDDNGRHKQGIIKPHFEGYVVYEKI